MLIAFFACQAAKGTQIHTLRQVSGTDFNDGDPPVAPSAIRITNGQLFSPKQMKMVDYPVPRALESDEVTDITRQAVEGAKNAILAGKSVCTSIPFCRAFLASLHRL